jgi:PAS domain S-box-containing protein
MNVNFRPKIYLIVIAVVSVLLMGTIVFLLKTVQTTKETAMKDGEFFQKNLFQQSAFVNESLILFTRILNYDVHMKNHTESVKDIHTFNMSILAQLSLGESINEGILTRLPEEDPLLLKDDLKKLIPQLQYVAENVAGFNVRLNQIKHKDDFILIMEDHRKVIQESIEVLHSHLNRHAQIQSVYFTSLNNDITETIKLLNNLLYLLIPLTVFWALLFIMYFVSQHREIMKRKRAEKELDRYRLHLEDLVEARTAELMKSNKKLKLEIDERKTAEKALMESEEKFRLLSENSLLGIAILQDNQIKYANQSAAEIIGYSIDEMMDWVSIDFAKLIYKEDLAFVAEQGQKKMEGNEDVVTHYSYRLLSKSCELKWVDQYSNTILYEGRPADFVTIIDITRQKQMEEQLQIRQRMDSLGTMAGGIAHDFNNLLVGIMGYIDLLGHDQSNFTETQKEYISSALKSSQRASDLVRQLQTLSQGVVSEKTSVDVYEIVKEVFEVLDKTTDRLIIKEVRLEPARYYVKANESELNQVFLNLGTNAVESIERRGAKNGDYVRVRAEGYFVSGADFTGLSEGKYVHIYFEDNGCGMSNDVKRKAFDPLFTTRDKGSKRGQGLGLAMVFNIITRRHGGHVDIDSTEGKGTVFHIYLPTGEPQKRVVIEESVKGGDETVLIIEDEDQVCRLAKSSLETFGYNVLTAADGEQGLTVYRKNRSSIDIVLLDLTMPKLSGKMVYKRMLKMDPEARVIICSGQSDDNLKEGILSSAGGFLKKPYRVNDLARIVRDVLDANNPISLVSGAF